MKINNFALIGELLELKNKSVTLIPGVKITKANNTQIEYIKNNFTSFKNLSNKNNHWEYSNPNHTEAEQDIDLFEIEDVDFQVQQENQVLNNFYVITFQKDINFKNLELSMLLAQNEMHLIFMYKKIYDFLFSKYIDSISYNDNLWFTIFLNNSKLFNRVQINETTIEEVRFIYETINNFYKRNESFTFITEAIDDYINLQLIPNESKLKILGYFIIIEKLLTHDSSNTDQTIKRQVSRKISLLNKRFLNPINLVEYFSPNPDTITENKILEQLYNYRSKLAHGETPDFINSLQILKSSDHANKIIKRLIKLVLIQSMHEPQLIKDLKDC